MLEVQIHNYSSINIYIIDSMKPYILFKKAYAKNFKILFYEITLG